MFFDYFWTSFWPTFGGLWTTFGLVFGLLFGYGGFALGQVLLLCKLGLPRPAPDQLPLASPGLGNPPKSFFDYFFCFLTTFGLVFGLLLEVFGLLLV